jgi:hypothetical protein
LEQCGNPVVRQYVKFVTLTVMNLGSVYLDRAVFELTVALVNATTPG